MLGQTVLKSLSIPCPSLTLRNRPSCATLAASHGVNISTFNGLRASGALRSRNSLPGLQFTARNPSRGARHLRVQALFEKFTERSIKSVMLAQEWARNASDTEVNFQQLLNNVEFFKHPLLAASPTLTFYSL